MIASGFLALISNILFFTSSMASESGSYPKKLDPEEERALIENMIAGDKTARGELANHNLRLVMHIAKKYTNYNDMDDLISVGQIGLLKGLDSYSIEKKTALATYCARCIENEMLMVIRGNKKRVKDAYLSDSIGTDKEGNELTLLDLFFEADGEDTVAASVETKEVYSRLMDIMKEYLEEREYKIIKLRYGFQTGECLTQREIADKFKISRSYISRIEKKSLEKLHELIVRENLHE